MPRLRQRAQNLGAVGAAQQVSSLCPAQADLRICLLERSATDAGVLDGVETALRRGLVDIALCWVMSDAGLRRSNTDASPRTVYLTQIAMAHLHAIRPDDADGSDPVLGLSVASISRRVKAAAGLGVGYSGHSGWVGMARRMARAGARPHEIMAQGRWHSAGMVADLVAIIFSWA